MLKTRVFFKIISGKHKGKTTKLDFRKKHKVAGFVSYNDGTNKQTYQISFGRFKPRKHRLNKALRQRIYSAMREVSVKQWNKYVKVSARKIQRRNFIVYGSHYKKTAQGLRDWFEHSYADNQTGEIVENMYYDENIKDKATNYVEVKRTIVQTEKNVTTTIYKFTTNPDNHPSFVLQNTDFNDFDNPEKYQAVMITYSITFIGVGGKEFTLPEKIYTFDYFKELYKVRNKWLLQVDQNGHKANFYTPTGLVLGKIRADMAQMGWSMSGAFYQMNPKKPLQTSQHYTINITVQAVHDTTDGKFLKKHNEVISNIVKTDRKQRELFKRALPENIFTSQRIGYYSNMSRHDLWKKYIAGETINIKMGINRYKIKGYKEPVKPKRRKK